MLKKQSDKHCIKIKKDKDKKEKLTTKKKLNLNEKH